jgi:hypothetical protein
MGSDVRPLGISIWRVFESVVGAVAVLNEEGNISLTI